MTLPEMTQKTPSACWRPDESSESAQGICCPLFPREQKPRTQNSNLRLNLNRASCSTTIPYFGTIHMKILFAFCSHPPTHPPTHPPNWQLTNGALKSRPQQQRKENLTPHETTKIVGAVTLLRLIAHCTRLHRYHYNTATIQYCTIQYSQSRSQPLPIVLEKAEKVNTPLSSIGNNCTCWREIGGTFGWSKYIATLICHHHAID